MDTLQTFILKHRIRLEAQLTDNNPNMADQWPPGATHWKCVLQCGKRRMTTYFSQGSAIAREPTAEDLLDSLASDATSIIDTSFEEWCRDLDYDTDSRKAEQTYRICKKQSNALAQLINDPDAYKTLLYNTERL